MTFYVVKLLTEGGDTLKELIRRSPTGEVHESGSNRFGHPVDVSALGLRPGGTLPPRGVEVVKSEGCEVSGHLPKLGPSLLIR